MDGTTCSKANFGIIIYESHWPAYALQSLGIGQFDVKWPERGVLEWFI
jgi:hypothetical protein